MKRLTAFLLAVLLSVSVVACSYGDASSVIIQTDAPSSSLVETSSDKSSSVVSSSKAETSSGEESGSDEESGSSEETDSGDKCSSSEMVTSKENSSSKAENSSDKSASSDKTDSRVETSSDESVSSDKTDSKVETSSDEKNSSSDSASKIESSSSEKVSSKENVSNTESSSSEPAKDENTSSDVVSSGLATDSSTNSSSETATSSDISSDSVSSEVVVPPSLPSGTVNPEDYHCYSSLNSNGKIIYNALLSAAINLESTWITIPVSGTVSIKDVSIAFYSLQNDHPEIYWLPSQYYVRFANDKISFLFANEESGDRPEASTYLVSRSEEGVMTERLNAAVAEIKSLVTATDPYGIELQLHDILCDRITYYEGDKKDPMLWTAYGALVNGSAVCEGYARAYQLLLYEFGINSTLATGVANNVGHMWNIVNINGKNYHADVTWDDRNDGGKPSFHAYFNLTDLEITKTHKPHIDYSLIRESEFEDDHTLNYNINLPECKDYSLNYFLVSKTIFNRGDEEALADYIIYNGGSVEYKYTLAEPSLSDIASLLNLKGSTLSVKGSLRKTNTSVVILEVK